MIADSLDVRRLDFGRASGDAPTIILLAFL